MRLKIASGGDRQTGSATSEAAGRGRAPGKSTGLGDRARPLEPTAPSGASTGKREDQHAGDWVMTSELTSALGLSDPPAVPRAPGASTLSGASGASASTASGAPRPRAASPRQPTAVQARGDLPGPSAAASAHETAAAGVSGAGSALPYLDQLQPAFGQHSLGDVRAHVGGEAADASRSLGAEAYALGNNIAFKQQPDLHTAAHEAAHVVQQRAGVQLEGGLGKRGDAYERQADAVADAVVAGRSAEPLLGAAPASTGSASSSAAPAIQRQDATTPVEDVQTRARRYAQRVRDGLAATTLLVFSSPDGGVVREALTQPAEVVRAIRDIYDAELNTLSGRGLVADLGEKFGGQDLEFMGMLLARAGIPFDAAAFTLLRQSAEGAYATETRITASPQVASSPPGASITYSAERGAEIYATGSYYSYQWYCLNDPLTREQHGAPARIDGPSSASWNATWGFPGDHTIICRVQFHPAGEAPRTPEYLEYRQNVRPIGEIGAEAFAETESADFVRFRAGLEMHTLDLTQNGVPDQNFGGTHIRTDGPNPAVPGIAPGYAHHSYTVEPIPGATRFHWYALCEDMTAMPTETYHGHQRIEVNGRAAYAMGSGTTARWIIASYNVYTITCEQRDDADQLLGTATYRQVVHSEERERIADNWREYTARVDQQIQGIDAARRVGIRASYVSGENGATMTPTFFIGPDAAQPARLKLLDLTPGISRIEYGGADVEGALSDFVSGNSYPRGRITFEIPANEAGIPPTTRVIETDGSSDFATWASNLGWASLGLAVAGIAASVIPGGQVFAPALFIAAAGAGVASGSLSIYDQLQQAEVSGLSIAIDVLGIASSIIGGAVAFRTARMGARVALAGRAQMLLYVGAGLDVASGVLLSIEGFDQIIAILDSDMPEGEKISAVVRILAALAVNGGLIALSVRDARSARTRVAGLLGGDALSGLSDDIARNLDALDDAALRALATATPAQLGQIAQLATINPAAMNRLIRVMGVDVALHQIVDAGGGLVRINGQLDIHPSVLAQIPDADLRTILEATRSGDHTALQPFTRSAYSPRLRFRFQLTDGDDYINSLLDGAGIPATDPRRQRLFGAMDDASRTRLFDLSNRGYPRGVTETLPQSAARYALDQNPDSVRAFVEHFEMFTSEFTRRSDELMATQGLNGRSRAQFNAEVLAGITPESVRARYTELAGYLDGRAGSTALGNATIPDSDLVPRVRALADVRFGSESAAVYHANKHHGELPLAHRATGSDIVTAYLDSANQTIRQGTPEISVAQNGTRRIDFTHTYPETPPRVMRAMVYVDAQGNVTLATYGTVN